MPHTIDQSCVVKSFLVKQCAQITADLVLVGPVVDDCLHILEHFHNLDIGTTMLRSLQRADRCSDSRVGICSGGRYQMCGKCRVVTTAMLHMQDQGNIQKLGFEWSVGTVRS